MDKKQQTDHIGDVNKKVEHHIADTNKMITAVSWLINRFNYIRCIYADDFEDGQMIESAINIAREMEKEQIMKAHIEGQPLYSCQSEKAEQYYNENYNK
jgi:hypothetical protein